jgi:hypothetical protein
MLIVLSQLPKDFARTRKLQQMERNAKRDVRRAKTRNERRFKDNEAEILSQTLLQALDDQGAILENTQEQSLDVKLHLERTVLESQGVILARAHEHL